MPQISDRVQLFTDSVIRRMTRISNKYGAINLSQGFPDFDPPRQMKEALAKAALEGPHQYSVTFGAKNLREAIYIPLVPPEYTFDRELIEQGFKQGAKAIVICNPSNPCGKVFTEEELRAIGDLALRYDAYVVTDEVYEHLVYEPYHHTYMSALSGMYDHTITCNSLSKTFSVTGWRLGYIIGPERVVEAAKKVHDFLTVGAAAPLQEAAVAGLMLDDSYYEELKQLYTGKRDYMLEGLDRTGLKHNVPQGTYFIMLDIQEFLDTKMFKGRSDLEFCEWMIKEVGVAAVPGSSFFREDVNRYIRLHFARGEEVLEEAIKRLTKLKQLPYNADYSAAPAHSVRSSAHLDRT